MKKQSKKRWSIQKTDEQKWLKNTVIFFAPALIMFLTALANGVPLRQAAYALYLWGLNAAIDLLRKYSSQK